MAYKITGGTTVGGSSSSSGGSGHGVKITGGTTVGVDLARANAGAGASFTEQRKRDTPGSSTPVATVLGSVLTGASVPAYGVGQAILHPLDKRTWTASGKDYFSDPKLHVMPGQALRQRGALNVIPDKYGLRGAAAFVGDVALDPTTYLSFGGGAALRAGAEGVAQHAIGEAASKYLDDIVKAGREPTLHDIAHAASLTAAERKAAQNTLKVGVVVPFTRGKKLVLAESAKVHDAASAIARKIGATDAAGLVKQGVSTGRGLDPVVSAVFANLSRAARRETATISDAALKLEHDVYKAVGRRNGQDALKAISLHLDNPSAYALPSGLEEFATRARNLLDSFYASEQAAGIDYRGVENYVSHLGATSKDRKRIAQVYAPTAASLDDPFFVKARDAANLDEFARAGRIHGFTPEYNIARIIERRGRASVRARLKKALDEAVIGTEGVKPPPRSLPETAKAEARVAERQQQLAAVRGDVQVAPPVVPEQAAAYNQALASLRQAQIANDPNAAADARRMLESLTSASAGSSPRDVVRAERRLSSAQARLAQRQQKVARIEQANADLAARPGRPSTPEEWKALRGQWAEVQNATKYHAGTLLPPEVLDSLNRVHARINPAVASESALRHMGETVAAFTSRWKALALLSPGYHVRNLYDDGMRAYWAGARNPLSFTQASKLLKARKGKGDVGATVTIRGQKWTRQELLRRAEAHDVIDTGYAKIETHSSADATGRRRIVSLPGEGHLTRGSQAVGQYRENVLRLGTWIELLKKGENPAEAARVVREFLFDYTEVGAAVEAARRFWAPFITYPSKAIPFVTREFARRPGRAANLNAAMTDLTAAAGNPDLSQIPLGSQSSFAVPLPTWVGVALGGKPGQPNLVNPERLFSFGNLNQLDVRRKNLLLNASGVMNPFAAAAAQDLTGFSFYFGRPFAKRVKAPLLLQGLHSVGVPIQGFGPKYDSYLNQTVPGYSPFLDTFLRTFPPFSQSATLASGDTSKTQSALARYLGGVPFSPYDRAKDVFYAQRYGEKKP